MKLTVATAALLTEAATATMSSSSSVLHGKSSLPLMKHTSSSSIEATRRQLEALQSIQSKEQQAQQDHVFESAKALLKNKKQIASSSSSSRGSRLRDWMDLGYQRQLVELVQQEGLHYKECTRTKTPKDADVGILSCGQGRYCLESDLVAQTVPFGSSTGGICIDMPSDATVKVLNVMAQRRQAQADSGRTLQILQDGASILEDMYSICYGNFSSPNVVCECTGLDMTSYRGSVSCQHQQLCGDLTNVCETNVTFCYKVSYQLEVSAPYTGGFQTMYEFTVPTLFRYQYGVNYAGSLLPESCNISFNDTQCQSCEFTQTLYDGSIDPSDCISFDCSNTALGMSATLCENTIVETVIADYLLYGSLPCDNGCNLCGNGGYMTQTEQNVTFPTGEIYKCRLVDTAALAGYFETAQPGQPDMCTVLPSIVNGPCGCVGGDNVTGTPTVAGVTDPPMTATEPTTAPVTAPNDEVATGTAPISAATNTKTEMMLGSMAAAVMGWFMMT